MYRAKSLLTQGSSSIALSAMVVAACLNALSPLAQGEDAAEKGFPKLEFRKWSGKINVPDPVAISVDDRGRVFVTQTRRRKIQDLDIREHAEWIPNDLSFGSVGDKRDFYRRRLAIGGDQERQRKHVDDWNQDGVHDWRDLTVVSEAIYRLEDQDGDLTADSITTFAEDFRTEVTGVAAGVLAFDDHVYATVAPDVWKLRDHDDDGRADSREVLATGFGLHIAYGGHDMHGLTIGPDGKVYWSIGDKGIHVETADGQTFSFPHQGGVMRANPDGSKFEVFAHGLRNVQEVAFDAYGNMFGVDNDSDQPNEKERFVYIVDGMDAGWRCYYQYREADYNPWTDERLWELAGDDHPAYIVPPISHYVDGPAGFKFNPGTALSPEYRDFFFLTSAPNGFQYAFRTERRGDSFAMLDQHQIGEGLAIVGLSFGPDGALYGADWDGGYPLDEKGSVIRIDLSREQLEERGIASERAKVRELIASDFEAKSKDELISLLSHADMRIRLQAQFALVNQQATSELSALVLRPSTTVFAKLHAIWGLGQLARGGDLLGRDTLAIAFRDGTAEVRGQAVKTYGELSRVVPEPILPQLDDEDPYVQTLATLALARHPTPKAQEALLKLCNKLKPDQHYLRHGIVSALASCASPEDLGKQATDENTMRRLVCALALRRQSSPRLASYLEDASAWIATEAARGIHDERSIAEALPRLAAALLERKEQTEAFFRRAVNANLRLGDADSMKRLLSFAADPAQSVERRIHVLESLASWNEPLVLDRVEGIYRPLVDAGERQIDFDVLNVELETLAFSSQAEIRPAALQAASALGVRFSMDRLQSMVLDSSLDKSTRNAALKQIHEQWNQLLEDLRNDESPYLRLQALQLQNAANSISAVKGLEGLLDEEVPWDVKQSAIRSISKAGGESPKAVIETLGREMLSGELPEELYLDVWRAIQRIARQEESFVGLKKSLMEARELSDEQAMTYNLAAAGGDYQRGELLFRNHGQAQCARCHRVGDSGSEIGPPLGEIAKKRDAKYLLRSIVDPSADIEAEYRTHVLLLESDEVLTGVIQQRDENQTLIADSNGEVKRIDNDEILAANEQKVSLMPPMTEILTAEEIRDLVAYLQTLK